MPVFCTLLRRGECYAHNGWTPANTGGLQNPKRCLSFTVKHLYVTGWWLEERRTVSVPTHKHKHTTFIYILMCFNHSFKVERVGVYVWVRILYACLLTVPQNTYEFFYESGARSQCLESSCVRRSPTIVCITYASSQQSTEDRHVFGFSLRTRACFVVIYIIIGN